MFRPIEPFFNSHMDRVQVLLPLPKKKATAFAVVFSFVKVEDIENPEARRRAGQRRRSAASGGNSKARLAQRSKRRTERCGSRFGNRKRACEASSSPTYLAIVKEPVT